AIARYWTSPRDPASRSAIIAAAVAFAAMMSCLAFWMSWFATSVVTIVRTSTVDVTSLAPMPSWTRVRAGGAAEGGSVAIGIARRYLRYWHMGKGERKSWACHACMSASMLFGQTTIHPESVKAFT